MVVSIILGVSILIQLYAVMLALRLIKVTRHKTGWSLIAAAIAIMAVRKGIIFYRLLVRADVYPLDFETEAMSLVLSAFMAGGLYLITPFFETLRRSESEAILSNKALKALSGINEAVMTAAGEDDLLARACRIIVETGGYRLAWVGYAEGDEAKTVRPAASCGFENGYLGTLNITWADTERGRGPTGTAIRTGEPSIVKNIGSDPRFAPWRREAEKRGYSSSAAFPLKHEGKCFGALNIYSAEAVAFDEAETDFFMRLANDLAFGIISIRARAERERARRDMFESEARLSAVTSAAQDAIIMLDDESRIRFWNPAAEKMFGYSEVEIMGESAARFILPSRYRERHSRGFELFSKTGQGPVVGKVSEITAVRKNGEEFPIALSVSSIQLDGRWHAVGVVRDITESKRNEEELKKKTHDLGERVKEARCLYGISSLLRQPRINLDSVLPAAVRLIPPGWQYPEMTCARIVLGGKEYKTENFAVTEWKQSSEIVANGEATGAVEVYYLQEAPREDEGPFLSEERALVNALAGIFGAAVEEIGAAAALRASERKYRDLFEYANEGIIILDAETLDIIEANKTAATRMGYTRNEFLKLNVRDINFPGYDPMRDIPLKDLREGKNVMFERLHRRKDGSSLPVEISARMVDFEGRKCLQGFVRDVSGRKAAERALTESERRLSALMSALPGIAYRCANDREWTMEFISEGCRDLTGYRPADIIGNRLVSFASLIHPEDRDMVWSLVQSALGKKEPYRLAYRIIAASKDVKWVWEKGAGVFSEKGELLALEGFVSDITPLKRAEEMIAESESRMRVITDTAIDAIIQMDGEGLVTFWNPAAEAMFGYTAAEAAGRDLHELIAPKRYYGSFKDAFAGFQESGKGPLIKEKVTEIQALHKNGTEFPVELALSSVKIKGKWSAVGVVRDLSARKRMEDWLYRLSMAIDATPTIVMITDAKGGIEYVNPSFTRITGFTMEDVSGMSAGDQKGHSAADSMEMWKTLEKEGEWEGEFYNLRKDGSRYWEHAIISAVRGRDGSVQSYLKVAEDVTGRKEAERMLRESEEKFRIIFESAMDGVLVAGVEDKKFLMANDTMCAMLGYTLGEVKTLSVADLHSAEDLPRVLDQFQRQAAKKLRVARGLPVKRKNGSVFYADISAAPVTLGGKKYLVGMFRDVTEQRQWEKSLEEANEKLQKALADLEKTQSLLIRSEKLASLGGLSAGVAHEIKNPLNIISTSIQLLMMEENVPEETMKAYQTVIDQVKRTVKITDNLRDFARERKPEITGVNLHEFLDKTIALVQYEMRTESIEIMRIYDPRGIYIKGDPDQLAQVFLNIIGNARDSMNEKQATFSYDQLGKMGWRGRLTIETHVLGSMASIKFRDTGMGISRETMNKVFDPFFTTKPEGKGTGLGMAIAYGIIENHGGTIEIDSVEGEWAEIIVTLPLAGDLAV